MTNDMMLSTGSFRLFVNGTIQQMADVGKMLDDAFARKTPGDLERLLEKLIFGGYAMRAELTSTDDPWAKMFVMQLNLALMRNGTYLMPRTEPDKK